MAEQDPPSLAERIIAISRETLLRWLATRGPLILTLAYLLAIVCQCSQQVMDRPEVLFLFDLTIGTVVAIGFSVFLRVYTHEVVQYARTTEFGNTSIGHWTIIVMEAIHFLPLLVLFAFQTLRLCKDLRRRLENE